MSKEERADWLRHTGKGYLSREEQAERLRLHHGDIESVYIAEAWKAHEAKDDEVFWQWFSLLVAPAHALKSLKGISKNSIPETLFSIKSISYSLQVVGIDNF